MAGFPKASHKLASNSRPLEFKPPIPIQGKFNQGCCTRATCSYHYIWLSCTVIISESAFTNWNSSTVQLPFDCSPMNVIICIDNCMTIVGHSWHNYKFLLRGSIAMTKIHLWQWTPNVDIYSPTISVHITLVSGLSHPFPLGWKILFPHTSETYLHLIQKSFHTLITTMWSRCEMSNLVNSYGMS